ncbi:hypothetical protein GCM10010492_20470 [Saccharothrix mutabilis subsp. mutabilis]|uniref:Uncharacterized protein n=1 Tax=Saccharothrix mutabilis subsp. mutabilis TaxID=66855 RepID=A0ABN0TI05_9PSEU
MRAVVLSGPGPVENLALAATRVHGTVCFTGMLSDQWLVRDFHPIGYLPKGVRLTAYGGEAADLPAEVLQRYLDQVAAGEVNPGPTTVYRLEDIRAAPRRPGAQPARRQARRGALGGRGAPEMVPRRCRSGGGPFV